MVEEKVALGITKQKFGVNCCSECNSSGFHVGMLRLNVN